ncbi:MAG: DEAD/DEAH box helicase, partial [bacterium]
NKLFIYSVPSNLEKQIVFYKRVLVPFGHRQLKGFIIEEAFFAEIENLKKIKDIIKVLDTEPVIQKDLLELSQWMADYYICSYGEVLNSIVPDLNIKKKVNNHPQSISIFKPPIILTEEQKTVLNSIYSSIEKNNFASFLLHGVTGSGKTEIYVQAIKYLIENKKKQAIVLLPEISLTPQIIQYFKDYFGEKISVWHSHLSSGEKADEWKKIKNGEVDIVIGARSAIFAPF